LLRNMIDLHNSVRFQWNLENASPDALRQIEEGDKVASITLSTD